MIFIKPEEKEEFTSSFFVFFKLLRYFEIQMCILCTEKSLKLCFLFFPIYVFFPVDW